jgi:ADP-ribosyl-[dinitrogen reductase] hydrolase
MSTFKDRALGSFIGLAVGDALGAPIEFKERDTYTHLTEMTGGGYFSLKAGQWTDDTSQALCLAESLIECPGYDPLNFAEKLSDWVIDGKYSSTGKCFGIGQTTLQALGQFNRTRDPDSGVTHLRGDSNGSIMRMAPAAIRWWKQPHLAVKIAGAQSKVTHNRPIVIAACEYMALLICGAIANGPTAPFKGVATDPEWPVEVLSVARQDYQLVARDNIKSDGYVLSTLSAAIWAIQNTDNFEDALLLAVNLGHDADTVGAVTGQIAGAIYGVASIPQQWFSSLSESGYLLGVGARLFLPTYE